MQSFVEKVLEALAQAGVEFIIVGGVSAVLQGVPIVTQDLDIATAARRTTCGGSRRRWSDLHLEAARATFRCAE